METAIKKEVLDLIKSININELDIPDEAQRKWFKFGAYEFGRLLAEKVKEK